MVIDAGLNNIFFEIGAIYMNNKMPSITKMIDHSILHPTMTDEELRMGLMSNFNISISGKEIRKILNDLDKLGKLRKIKKDTQNLWEILET